MNLLFVYGTLKKGFHNHRFLEGLKFKKAVAPDLNLYNGPGYPYVKKGKGVVHGELYEIDNDTLLLIDRLEGHPNHYKRVILPVIDGDGNQILAWIYLANIIIKTKRIKSGVWEKN